MCGSCARSFDRGEAVVVDWEDDDDDDDEIILLSFGP
jgi:hypothetical protein